MITLRTPTVIAALCLSGVAYWLIICALAGVSEPWDAPAYWTVAYPASLVLAGIAGYGLRRRGWLAGAVLTLCQFPVMLALSGPGAMWFPGLLMLGVLALPATGLAALTGWLGHRHRRA